MPRFDLLTDQQRRHLAHIYAALRECIAEEVDYDREPEFAPLDEETRWAVSTMLAQQMTALMFVAHAEEAAKIEAVIAGAEAAVPMSRLTVQGNKEPV